MNKVKSVLKLIKNWIVGNGIEGAAGLGVGVGLWIFGLKIWAGVAFGIFIHEKLGLSKVRNKEKVMKGKPCTCGHTQNPEGLYDGSHLSNAKMSWKNIFKDDNQWNEKAIVGFISFLIMCIVMMLT